VAAQRGTTARALILVERQAATRAGIVRRLLAGLSRLWTQLEPADRYDPKAVERFAGQAASLTRLARQTASGSTQAYLGQLLADLDTAPGRVRITVPADVRGVDPVEVYQRPVKDYRRLRLAGLDELEAADRAERRLTLIGETDVALTVRDTSRQVLAAADRVTGYRRVIHPELSKGGTCGLCVAASDRIYRVDVLMPLHDRCNCETLPVVRGKSDPGAALNAESLAELYQRAGSTAAGDLAKVRYAVHAHGELGPVLRADGDHFRGPAETAALTA
jgi:hypothetical protein